MGGRKHNVLAAAASNRLRLRRKQREAHSSSKEWHARFTRGVGGAAREGEGSRRHHILRPARKAIWPRVSRRGPIWDLVHLEITTVGLAGRSLFVVFLMGRVSERRPDRCHFLSPTRRPSGATSAHVVCLLNASSFNRLNVCGGFFWSILCVFCDCGEWLLGLALKSASCPCSSPRREFGRWKVNSLALERQENNGLALPLDPEFLQTIRQLGRRPSLSAITDNIIRKYGTHFLLSATLGGKHGTAAPF